MKGVSVSATPDEIAKKWGVPCTFEKCGGYSTYGGCKSGNVAIFYNQKVKSLAVILITVRLP